MWRIFGFTQNSSEEDVEIPPQRSLPASWYRSSSLYELERRAIFSRRWILLTHRLRFTEAGEYLLFDYGGFSFFLIRDRQGNINGFHNVCRHRAFPVVQQGCGKTSVLSCKYHGWSYSLKGDLAKAPRFDTVKDFDKKKHGLLPIHVHIDKIGFVWVNLQAGTPETPWESEFGGIDEQPRLAQFGHDQGYLYDHTWDMEIDANWKAVMENYNECYHCPTSHPLIAGVSDITKYRVEPNGSVLEHTIVNKSSPEDEDELRRSITFFFPSTSATITRNFFYIQRMIPLGPNKTKVENEIYRHRNASDENFADVMAFYKQVLTEDKMLCEGAQKNLEIGVYRNGELHPDKEKGPIEFQAIVRSELLKHRKREQSAGGTEIWPATPVIDKEANTAKLSEEERFCSELEAASCSTRSELAW